MKRIVLICIAAIICVAIFAIPLYYQTFFKTDAVPLPQTVTTTETQNKYLMVGDGDHALILNQETGDVYWIKGKNITKCTDDINQ